MIDTIINIEYEKLLNKKIQELENEESTLLKKNSYLEHALNNSTERKNADNFSEKNKSNSVPYIRNHLEFNDIYYPNSNSRYSEFIMQLENGSKLRNKLLDNNIIIDQLCMEGEFYIHCGTYTDIANDEYIFRKVVDVKYQIDSEYKHPQIILDQENILKYKDPPYIFSASDEDAYDMVIDFIYSSFFVSRSKNPIPIRKVYNMFLMRYGIYITLRKFIDIFCENFNTMVYEKTNYFKLTGEHDIINYRPKLKSYEIPYFSILGFNDF